MSNALNRLRGALNDDLFVRDGNAMRPTKRADQLSSSIGLALNAIREGLSDTGTFDPSNRRSFSVAGNEHFELVLLPRIMQSKLRYESGLHIEVERGIREGLEAKLKSGELDLIIDNRLPLDEELQIQQITTNRLVPLMRPEHPMAGKTLDQSDILQLDYIVHRSAEGQGYHIEEFLRSANAEKQIKAVVKSMLAMPVIAASADLVCAMPEPVAEFFIKGWGFHKLEGDFPDFSAPIYMIWHKNQNHDAAQGWLREEILSLSVKQ